MRIHHLRNATMIIETSDKVVLIDPMIGSRGTAAPPFAFFRFRPQRNPIIDLPEGAMEMVNKTTHCLVTHLHPDHLDKEAERFLKIRGIPVICSVKDKETLIKRGLNVVQAVDYWIESELFEGRIEGIPARHGYGFVAKPMGNVMGYFIKFPNEKSVYLSSDTVYTNDVHKVLNEYKPEITVLACGSAQLDLFKPLLMNMEDIIRFIENSPFKVIANHLEALNHCPTTRKQLRTELKARNLDHKIFIPEDGEAIDV